MNLSLYFARRTVTKLMCNLGYSEDQIRAALDYYLLSFEEYVATQLLRSQINIWTISKLTEKVREKMQGVEA